MQKKGKILKDLQVNTPSNDGIDKKDYIDEIKISSLDKKKKTYSKSRKTKKR